jgi:hypothetical protein
VNPKVDNIENSVSLRSILFHGVRRRHFVANVDVAC